MNIHPLAVVSPQAHLGPGVTVHPFSVIEPGAVVGEGCVLESHVVIKSGTVLGPENHIFEGSVLGGLPQHIQCPTETGSLVIGAGNTIRENVTIHRAMAAGNATSIGDHNLLMVNTHVAHDCALANHVIMANNVMLAGHVEIQDRAYLSGAVGIHQFCRVGRYAMVGGQARVVKDIPPFVTIDGVSTQVVGLNKVGLRRNGFSRDDIKQLKAAYQLIYRSSLTWAEVLEQLALDFSQGPAAEFTRFFQGGQRGFTPERRAPRSTTLKLAAAPVVDDAAEFKAKAG